MQDQQIKPLLLLILDGWGHNDTQEYNAIKAANTPNWDKIQQNYPYTTLDASGLAVGLPVGQMGNSEVGHLNIGAGRCVYQSLTRINKSISEGDFANNALLNTTFATLKKSGAHCHLFGLLSPGGIHSHQDHLFALIRLAKEHGIEKIVCHVFLDGRDTPPQSAMASINALNALFVELGCGQIASISGRYYAMDRDKRWDRIQYAYDCMTQGKSDYHFETAALALEAAYQRGETDEFVKPTVIHTSGVAPCLITDDDVVIFMNFRADRARQLTQAFVSPDFSGFTRLQVPKLASFICLTEYDKALSIPVIYPPEQLVNTLGEVIANQGWPQLRIAETEKYAHVTFFFNGGVEAPFPLEQRQLIPSPNVATYDLQPQMSVVAVADKVVEAILSKQYPVIICNFANADMVGHTGNFAATIKAIEEMDQQFAKVLAALEETHGICLISADHGNADCMEDAKTHVPHTAHTNAKVPFVVIGAGRLTLRKNATLSDIAPTVLALLNIDKPVQMTGCSIIEDLS